MQRLWPIRSILSSLSVEKMCNYNISNNNNNVQQFVLLFNIIQKFILLTLLSLKKMGSASTCFNGLLFVHELSHEQTSSAHFTNSITSCILYKTQSINNLAKHNFSVFLEKIYRHILKISIQILMSLSHPRWCKAIHLLIIADH